MRRIVFCLLLPAGLLAGCATSTREVHDENSDRIDAEMKPEAQPDKIPEGVALSDDAPPLAAPDPQPEHVVNVPAKGPRPRGHRNRGLRNSVRYHVEPRPGGSTPGLLP